jgi:hypothetical protein
MASEHDTRSDFKVKTRADIVFCIDNTGSMTPCIQGVKDGVNRFVEGLHTSANVDFRLRLIAYRDLDDGDVIEEYEPGQPGEIETFRRQVSQLETKFGTTDAESTLDAIYVAARQDWLPNAHHALVVFTDSDCHPTLHSSTVERFRLADNSVQRVIDALTSEKVQLFLVAPDCPQYRQIDLGTKSASLTKIGDAHQNLENFDYKGVLEEIGKTVSSASRAFTVTNDANWGEL